MGGARRFRRGGGEPGEVGAQALGDDGKAQRFIKTTHGRGFRFVAAVEVAPPAAVVAPTAGDRGDREAARRSPTRVAAVDRRPPLRLVGDPGRYAAIADGLPDELIAEMSRLRWLFVTARGSSFRARLADVDAGEIGRLLGVRYCLSGTVEIAGTRLTIAVELIDTRDGGVVWADRFAGAIDDVHAIRAEIRSRVLTELEIRIPLHEAALARLTGTENLDAWAAYHLGLQHMFRFNREDNAAATTLFERAVALDSGFARAHAGLSFLHFQTAFLRHTDDLSGEMRWPDAAPNAASSSTTWTPREFHHGPRFGWLGTSTACPGSSARRRSVPTTRRIYARAWTESLSGQGVEGREHVDLAMRLSPWIRCITACWGPVPSPIWPWGRTVPRRVGRARSGLAGRPRADRDDRGRRSGPGGDEAPRRIVGRQRARRNPSSGEPISFARFR